jgi:hypothetical protein
MALIDVTSHIGPENPAGDLQALLTALKMDIGPQHDSGQMLFSYSGVGWTIEVEFTQGGHTWYVNIDDDTLAVAFKLKWL